MLPSTGAISFGCLEQAVASCGESRDILRLPKLHISGVFTPGFSFSLRDFEVQVGFWIDLQTRRRKQHAIMRDMSIISHYLVVQRLYTNTSTKHPNPGSHSSILQEHPGTDGSWETDKHKALGGLHGRTLSCSPSTSWQQDRKQNLPGSLLKISVISQTLTPAVELCPHWDKSR